MNPDRSEILRYMKMGRAEPDAPLSVRIDQLEREVLAAARPRYVARLSDIDSLKPIGLLESKDLKRTLGSAERAYLFAATLGHDVDRVIRKYSISSASDLLIVQAIAATLIEQYIDNVTASWGERLLPRFSPGYGDLPLSVQTDFLSALDAQKTLGITLTETMLMIPSKSVTAVIGVQP